MNPRAILLFFVAVAAGFGGVFLYSKTARPGGVSVDPSPVAKPTQEPALEPSTSTERRPAAEPGGTGGVQPVERRPEPDPVAKAEPALAELEGYRAHVEVGRIEGIVLVGKEPAVEAPIHVWEAGGDAGTASDGALTPPASAWRTTTTTEGNFEVTGLAAGRYRVLVEWGALQREIPLEMKEGVGSKRIVCVLGMGSIQGRVLSTEGAPLIGARVTASELGPWIGGDGRIAHTVTGADGRYRLEGLLAGQYWVSARHKELPGGVLDDHPQVRLVQGTSYELDLGRAAAGLWSGVLRDADGEEIHGPRLVLLHETTSGLERRFLTDSRGTFQEALPQGTYTVTVGFQNQIMLDAGRVEMAGTDLRLDLTCTTRPVVLRPECLDCPESPNQLAVLVAGALALESGGVRYRAEPPRAGGELRFYGLPPGEYVVELSSPFGATAGNGPLTLTADEAPAARDLAVFRE